MTMKPAPFVECSVCGREFGSKSIVIHERQCLQKLRRTEIDPTDAKNGETLLIGKKKNGNGKNSKPSPTVVNNFFITPFGKMGADNNVMMAGTTTESGPNRLPKLVNNQVQRNKDTKDRPSTVTLSRPKILNLDFIQYDMSLTRIDNTHSNSTTVKIKTVTSQPMINQHVPNQHQQQQTQFGLSGSSPTKFKSRSTGRINSTISATMGDDSFGGNGETLSTSKFPSVTSPPPPVIPDNNRMMTNLRRQKQDRERVKLPDSNSLFSTFSTMLGDPDPNRASYDPFKRSSIIQRSPTSTSTIADLHLHNSTMNMPSNNAQYSYYTAAAAEDEDMRDDDDDDDDDERMSFPKSNAHHDRPHVRVRSRKSRSRTQTTTVHYSLCNCYSYNDLTHDNDEQEQEQNLAEEPVARSPSSSSSWSPQRGQRQQRQHHSVEEECDDTNNSHNDNDDEIHDTTPPTKTNRIDFSTFQNEKGQGTKSTDQYNKYNQQNTFTDKSKITITKLPPITSHVTVHIRQEAGAAGKTKSKTIGTGSQQTTTLEFINQNQQDRRRRASTGRRDKSKEMDDEFVMLKHPPPIPMQMTNSNNSSVCNLLMTVKEGGKFRGRKVFRSTHSIILPEVHGRTKLSNTPNKDEEDPKPKEEKAMVKSRKIISSEDGEEFYETAPSSNSNGSGPSTNETSHSHGGSDAEDGNDSDNESELDSDDVASSGKDEDGKLPRLCLETVRQKEEGKKYIQSVSAPSLLESTVSPVSPTAVLQRLQVTTNVEMLPGYLRPKSTQTATATSIPAAEEVAVAETRSEVGEQPVQPASFEEPSVVVKDQVPCNEQVENYVDNVSMVANTNQSSQNTKELYQSTDEYLDYYNFLNDNFDCQRHDDSSSYSSHPSGTPEMDAQTDSKILINELADMIQNKLKNQLTNVRRKRSKPKTATGLHLTDFFRTETELSRFVNPFRKVKEWLRNSQIAGLNAELPEVLTPTIAQPRVPSSSNAALAACGGDADDGAVELVRPSTAPPMVNGAGAIFTVTDRSTLGTSLTSRFREEEQSRPATALPTTSAAAAAAAVTKKAKPKNKAKLVGGDSKIFDGLMQAVFRIREARRQQNKKNEATAMTPPSTRVYKFTDRMTLRLAHPSHEATPRTATAMSTATPTTPPKPKPKTNVAKKKVPGSATVKRSLVPAPATPGPKTKPPASKSAQQTQRRPATSPPQGHPLSPYLCRMSPASKAKDHIKGTKSNRPLTPIVKPKPFEPNPSSPPPVPIKVGSKRVKRDSVISPTPKSVPPATLALDKVKSGQSSPMPKKKVYSASKGCQCPEKQSVFTQSSPVSSYTESELDFDRKKAQQQTSILKSSAKKAFKLQDVIKQINHVASKQAIHTRLTRLTPPYNFNTLMTAGPPVKTKSVQFKELHERLSPVLPSRDELDDEEISCSPTKVCFHKSENETHIIYQFGHKSTSSSLQMPEVDRAPVAYTLLIPKSTDSKPVSAFSGPGSADDRRGYGEDGIDLNVVVRREKANGHFTAVETVIPEYLQDWIYLIVDEPRIPVDVNSYETTQKPSMEMNKRSDLQYHPDLPPVDPDSDAPSHDGDHNNIDLDLPQFVAVAKSEDKVNQEIKKLLKTQMKRKYRENKMLDYC